MITNKLSLVTTVHWSRSLSINIIVLLDFRSMMSWIESRWPATVHLLHRLEGEQDDARLDIQQLRSEYESLQEKLKIMWEGKKNMKLTGKEGVGVKIEEVRDQWIDR